MLHLLQLSIKFVVNIINFGIFSISLYPLMFHLEISDEMLRIYRDKKIFNFTFLVEVNDSYRCMINIVIITDV